MRVDKSTYDLDANGRDEHTLDLQANVLPKLIRQNKDELSRVKTSHEVANRMSQSPV